MTRFQNTGQPDWDWWEALWPDPTAVLGELGVDQECSVVDVCSGDGYFTIPAAELVGDQPLYAVELDEALLERLERNAADEDVESIVTRQGDARRLSEHLPRPVDLALLMNTFHGIEGAGAFVRELARALNPEGRVAVVNWHDTPRSETTIGDVPRGPPTDLRLSPSETRARFTSEGFVHERTVELPPYHYGQVFRRPPNVDSTD
ncbi:class I SAM-dependent methyltransferase [Halomarina rubra]|uniref:Class I SAM-dependent methyltransferase n=1 Tax=Halomarina rubra TaxID=2071873 RepID=A0ABD6AUE9_9EURY|nr:class I SAM-dependent methyltransferase [Halomarina rubra]